MVAVHSTLRLLQYLLVAPPLWRTLCLILPSVCCTLGLSNPLPEGSAVCRTLGQSHLPSEGSCVVERGLHQLQWLLHITPSVCRSLCLLHVVSVTTPVCRTLCLSHPLTEGCSVCCTVVLSHRQSVTPSACCTFCHPRQFIAPSVY